MQTSIFYSRPAPQAEDNHMIALKKECEATGGKFIEHDDAAEIFSGAGFTVMQQHPKCVFGMGESIGAAHPGSDSLLAASHWV
jgi:hypothetical protein